MRTRHLLPWTVALALTVATTTAPVAAAPLQAGAAQFTTSAPSQVEHVRWRGHGGAGVAAGIAAGMLLGGMIASSPYYYGGPPYAYGPPPYYGPGYYGPPDWEAYCFSRYRSFDPYSGTYLGYDGRRHLCR